MSAPANDQLAAAVGLAAGTTQAVGSNAEASRQAGEGGSGFATVWYSWRCPTAGQVIITTEGSTFDTVLGVWLGPAGGDPVTDPALLTLVGEDDDGGTGSTSRVAFTGQLGRVYYLQVGGWSATAVGQYVLNYPSPLALPDIDDASPEAMTTYVVSSPSTGQQWTLTDSEAGMMVLPGPQGTRLPPTSLLARQIPGLPGAVPLGVRVEPRDVTVPVEWWADTRAELLARRRAFDAALLRDARALASDPRAPLTAVITTERGERPRVIRGVYVGGAEGSEKLEEAGLTWQSWAFTLRCPWPYLSALEPERLEWGVTGAATTFFPILPLRLSSTALFGVSVVAVAGDIDTYPVWTITGPVTAVDAQSATGRWRLEYSVPAARSVTIDTTPGATAAVLDDGTNLWPYLAYDQMWPLSPGVQEVTVSAEGAGVGAIVSAEYYPQWATA